MCKSVLWIWSASTLGISEQEYNIVQNNIASLGEETQLPREQGSVTQE